MPFTIPEAIQALDSASLLSDDQIEALQSIIKDQEAKRFIQTIVNKTKEAYKQLYDETTKPREAYNSIWNAVKSWETARLYHSKAVTKHNLSRSQRAFTYGEHTPFDIRGLSDKEHDLIFLLAYAKINPLSSEQFDEVHKECEGYTDAGRIIRDMLQKRIDKDSVLSKVFPTQDRVIGKRKRDPAEPEPAFPKDREKCDCQ
jgi:formiminotetrahydrofolate cyclodeaminase